MVLGSFSQERGGLTHLGMGGKGGGLVFGRMRRQTAVKEAFMKNVKSRILSDRN